MSYKLEQVFGKNNNLPEWFVKAIDTSNDQVLDLFDEMSEQNKHSILEFAKNISELGVVGFGLRYFELSGMSRLFTLSSDWNELKKDRVIVKSGV
jgi:hypothetical protein